MQIVGAVVVIVAAAQLGIAMNVASRDDRVMAAG